MPGRHWIAPTVQAAQVGRAVNAPPNALATFSDMLHLALLARGAFMARRSFIALSLPFGDTEVEQFVAPLDDLPFSHAKARNSSRIDFRTPAIRRPETVVHPLIAVMRRGPGARTIDASLQGALHVW